MWMKNFYVSLDVSNIFTRETNNKTGKVLTVDMETALKLRLMNIFVTSELSPSQVLLP